MADDETRLLMLIDDEPAQSRLVSALAARQGWRTLTVTDGETAIATLGTREGMQLSAIILDQWVPGEESSTLIEELKSRRPALPILMLTASASPLNAVEAMRAGATDYLIKPVAPERLMQALANATRREAPGHELQPLAEKMPATLDFDAMIGTDPVFRTALARAAKVARGHLPVLIGGESGTGKEMLMRAMHAASPRAKTPLKLINCGGVPPSSIESLCCSDTSRARFLARSSARSARCRRAMAGRSRSTRSIGCPPTSRQGWATGPAAASCGRSGQATVSGSIQDCWRASNLPLDGLRAGGGFDPALLDAFGQTTIALPPLRERSGDVPALARHFLARIGEQPGLVPLSLADSALGLLSAYEWPGNVRQLQAVLFRAAVFCDGEALTAHDFPQLAEMIGDWEADGSDPHAAGVGVMLYTEDGNLRSLDAIEADVIRLAIGHYRGRMTEVARRLGIGRSTLYRKLGDLGIGDAA